MLIQEVSEAQISGNFYKVVVQLVRLYWLDIFCVGGYLEHIYWLVEQMVGERSVTFYSSVGMF